MDKILSSSEDEIALQDTLDPWTPDTSNSISNRSTVNIDIIKKPSLINAFRINISNDTTVEIGKMPQIISASGEAEFKTHVLISTTKSFILMTATESVMLFKVIRSNRKFSLLDGHCEIDESLLDDFEIGLKNSNESNVVGPLTFNAIKDLTIRQDFIFDQIDRLANDCEDFPDKLSELLKVIEPMARYNPSLKTLLKYEARKSVFAAEMYENHFEFFERFFKTHAYA